MATERDTSAGLAGESGRPERRTVLFLYSDTGGGHRSAAEAVIEALAARSPGSFRAVLCDPLTGPAAPWPLRLLAGLYGPAVRLAPWAWGAAYYVSNSRAAMGILGRTVFRPASKVVAAEVAGTGPGVIVSCHPLTGRPAVLAARRGLTGPVPVITVVTDLAAAHAAWRCPQADVMVVPSEEAHAEFVAGGVDPARCVEPGLPVDACAQAGPLTTAAQAGLRERLGLRPGQFVVLLTGGGEGCGGLRRRTAAIVRRLGDVHVITACGRNRRLRQSLSKIARRAPGRVTALGFSATFTDWLRCADVVVTKAGPGIVAEAACCGTPLLLTSHLPGQERRNAPLVLRAGAGIRARTVRGMVRELARLRADPALLVGLRAGCSRLARPDASARIAAIIDGLSMSADRHVTAAASEMPHGGETVPA